MSRTNNRDDVIETLEEFVRFCTDAKECLEGIVCGCNHFEADLETMISDATDEGCFLMEDRARDEAIAEAQEESYKIREWEKSR